MPKHTPLPPLDLTGDKPLAIPASLTAWLGEKKLQWIGGEPVERGPLSGNAVPYTFSTVNPATGENLAELVAADKGTVDFAVKTARKAFDEGAWRSKSLPERAAVLNRLADLVDAHRSALAILETLDNGKPIRESYEGDIVRAASNFRFFAGLTDATADRVFESEGNKHVASREPLGVVALITPWNLPLYLATWKIAPALLMGNSIVLKPSEMTPLTAAYFAELTAEAGVPAGVFNLVHGFGENSAGEFLVSHPGVNAVSFTGETTTGKAIMKSVSANLTRVSFELGGKGALVVFDDADWEQAADVAVRAGFRNQGEICLACPRVYVQDSLYDRFKQRYLAGVERLKMGDPLNPTTTLGALISEEHLNKVEAYRTLAIQEGRPLTGGTVRPPKGNFFAPFVVEGLPKDSRVNREEVFGPLVSLNKFKHEDEAIQLVNGTPYGLSSSLWTRDPARAKRVASAIQIGMVWINCWFVRDLRVPFGGQKKSGMGREGGTHSLDFFSEWKSVCYFGEGKKEC